MHRRTSRSGRRPDPEPLAARLCAAPRAAASTYFTSGGKVVTCARPRRTSSSPTRTERPVPLDPDVAQEPAVLIGLGDIALQHDLATVHERRGSRRQPPRANGSTGVSGLTDSGVSIPM